MNGQERLENYNSLTLFDKQWLLNVMLDRDVVVWFPHKKTLEAGEQYDATINGTQLQLNINVPEE